MGTPEETILSLLVDGAAVSRPPGRPPKALPLMCSYDPWEFRTRAFRSSLLPLLPLPLLLFPSFLLSLPFFLSLHSIS